MHLVFIATQIPDTRFIIQSRFKGAVRWKIVPTEQFASLTGRALQVPYVFSRRNAVARFAALSRACDSASLIAKVESRAIGSNPQQPAGAKFYFVAHAGARVFILIGLEILFSRVR